MAYTRQNTSVVYTYDEIPDRLKDNIVDTAITNTPTMGGIVADWVLLVFYMFLFVVFIWVFRRWLQ
jgi:hypothetical protein